MKLIKINNKDYIVKYSINGLIAMEQSLGRPFTEMFGTDGNVSLSTLRTLIFYGLKDSIHDLNEEGTGVIINDALEDGHSLTSITQEFVNELMKSLGMTQADVDKATKELSAKNV